MKDYLPQGEEKLNAFSLNFSTLINANFGAYGITKEIAGDYQVKQLDFSAKLQAATDPITRGKRTVFLKQEAKKILVALTRKVAKQIGATMTVTDAQRQELGITVPSGSRTPVAPPTARPFILLNGVDGRTVSMELRQNKATRGRPTKVTGAQIYMYKGEQPPELASDWVFMTAVSKTAVELPFGPSTTGDTVWITATWTNAKNETGPAAQPVSVNLPAGGWCVADGSRERAEDSQGGMRPRARGTHNSQRHNSQGSFKLQFGNFQLGVWSFFVFLSLELPL